MIKFSNSLSLEMVIKLEEAGWDIPSCQCDLPNLSDLLAELEARGWEYELSSAYADTRIYLCEAYKYANWARGVISKSNTYRADTPEEACGLALLWVLEQGKGERE